MAASAREQKEDRPKSLDYLEEAEKLFLTTLQDTIIAPHQEEVLRIQAKVASLAPLKATIQDLNTRARLLANEAALVTDSTIGWEKLIDDLERDNNNSAKEASTLLEQMRSLFSPKDASFQSLTIQEKEIAKQLHTHKNSLVDILIKSIREYIQATKDQIPNDSFMGKYHQKLTDIIKRLTDLRQITLVQINAFYHQAYKAALEYYNNTSYLHAIYNYAAGWIGKAPVTLPDLISEKMKVWRAANPTQSIVFECDSSKFQMRRSAAQHEKDFVERVIGMVSTKASRLLERSHQSLYVYPKVKPELMEAKDKEKFYSPLYCTQETRLERIEQLPALISSATSIIAELEKKKEEEDKKHAEMVNKELEAKEAARVEQVKQAQQILTQALREAAERDALNKAAAEAAKTEQERRIEKLNVELGNPDAALRRLSFLASELTNAAKENLEGTGVLILRDGDLELDPPCAAASAARPGLK